MTEFAVYVENVKTGQRKYCKVSQLLELESSTPPRGRLFKPKNVDDFTPGKYYGKIENNFVDKYYILKMGESVNVIKAANKNKRVRAPPPRRSVGPIAIPVSEFVMLDDKLKTVQQKLVLKEAIKTGKSKEQQSIVSRFRIKSNKSVSKNCLTDSKPAAICDIDSGECDKTKDFHDVKDKLEVVHTLDEEESQTVAASLEKERNVSCLKCSSLERQLSLALQEAESMRIQSDEYKRERDVLKQTISANSAKIDKISQDVSLLPEKIKIAAGVAADSWVSQIDTLLAPLNGRFKDMTIPENHVYLGNGITVSRQSLKHCADEFTMRGRMDALLEVIWNGEVYRYSKSGKRTWGSDLVQSLPVPESIPTAIHGILSAMPWDECKEIEKTKVRMDKINENIRKQTHTKRNQYIKLNFPNEFKNHEGNRKSKKIKSTPTDGGRNAEAAVDEVDNEDEVEAAEGDVDNEDQGKAAEYDVDNEDEGEEYGAAQLEKGTTSTVPKEDINDMLYESDQSEQTDFVQSRNFLNDEEESTDPLDISLDEFSEN